VEGTDYIATVGQDIDSYGRILRVIPKTPFRFSKGLVNIGYLVLVTDGVKTPGQQRAARLLLRSDQVRAGQLQHLH